MDKDSLDRTEGLEIIRRRGDAKREIPAAQDRTGQREREEKPRSRDRRSRRRRRRGRNKGRIAAVILIALLCAAALAGVFCFAGKRRAEAGREEAGAIRPERIAGDDTGTGLGGKATEAHTAAESGEKAPGEETGQSGEGAQAEGRSEAEKKAEEILDSMTLEEKILQLFMVTPEALTGYDEVYAAGEATKAAIEQYPVGGIVYFSQNLRDEAQTKDMQTRTNQYAKERTGLPMLLAVDEEGGQVARISGREGFALDAFPDMSDIGAQGDSEKAYEVGAAIGAYLAELGFNMDFAPVADVLTNPDNTVVKRRSFGSDAKTVANMVVRETEGLKKHGISPVLKHFPGHGGTAEDSHEGAAVIHRTVDELLENELIPFYTGIEAGADFVMVGHISDPEAVGDNRPAVFSKTLVTEVLRDTLKFDGIIITDAMNMGAITESCSSGDAAVKALEAGVDMILMPEDFKAACQGVEEAVEAGTIGEDRIEESVLRILTLKAEKQLGASENQE